MTNYKIIINKNGEPRLVEVPEKPDDKPFRKTDDLDGFLKLDIEYQQAISKELADESKHIAFKDVETVKDLLMEIYSRQESSFQIYKAGQTFDLPIGYSVSFEEEMQPRTKINPSTEGAVTRNVAVLTRKITMGLFKAAEFAITGQTQESEPSSKQALSEASEQKPPEPNDVAYTMHQLQMLINFLDQKGIGVKWNGEYWVDSQEQKPVVTQSEKVVTQEDISELERVEAIMDSILSKAPHYLYADSPMKMYLRPNVMAAMQEYSLLERSRAHNEAIQKCIDMVRDIAEWVDDEERIIPELEKLKSRQ